MRKYVLLFFALISVIACDHSWDPDVEIPEQTEAMEDYAPYGDPSLVVDD